MPPTDCRRSPPFLPSEDSVFPKLPFGNTIKTRLRNVKTSLVLLCAATYLRVTMINVRTLTPLELPRYRDHLLRLGANDRRLRFGCSISDEGIIDFVDRLSPLDTRVLAYTGPDLAVVGAVQVTTTSWQAVEFAFSVEAPYRGRGIATALLERASLWARNRGIRQAYVQCLAENHAMRRIARKAKMAMSTEAGESEGTLDIPSGTSGHFLEELAAETAGVWDAFAKSKSKVFGVLLPSPFAVE